MEEEEVVTHSVPQLAMQHQGRFCQHMATVDALRTAMPRYAAWSTRGGLLVLRELRRLAEGPPRDASGTPCELQGRGGAMPKALPGVAKEEEGPRPKKRLRHN